MPIAYEVVNGLLAAGMAGCAFAEFTQRDGLPAQMAKAKVPGIDAGACYRSKLWPHRDRGEVLGTGRRDGGWIGVAVYFVGAIVNTSSPMTSTFSMRSFLVRACAALTLRVVASAASGLGVLS
jgi:hypothetical protein